MITLSMTAFILLLFLAACTGGGIVFAAILTLVSTDEARKAARHAHRQHKMQVHEDLEHVTSALNYI